MYAKLDRDVFIKTVLNANGAFIMYYLGGVHALLKPGCCRGFYYNP